MTYDAQVEAVTSSKLFALKTFFERVHDISAKHTELAKISGENFNIFRILGLESSEVRTHSVFLAELLNAKGSHGQGDLFLKCFVELFEIEGFSTSESEACVEYYIGPISRDGTQGGRIDILLKDKNYHKIIIENKIYAEDQENQLLRYYNFDPSAKLFYLTLNGGDASNTSTGYDHNLNYKPISYREGITVWLKLCQKEAASLPLIRETITQYLILIEHLTCTRSGGKMKSEIVRLIKQNTAIMDAILLSNSVLQEILNQNKSQFFSKIKDELSKIDSVALSEDTTLAIFADEDGDGVYFGYRIKSVTENFIKPDSMYTQLLENCTDLKIYTTGNCWIGWWNPRPFRRGERFSDNIQRVLEMDDDSTKLDDLVKEIMSQEKEIRVKFIEQLKPVRVAPHSLVTRCAEN